MRKLIPTLVLAGTVALATLCEAGPRVRQAPPLLTPGETLCYGFGELTFDIAVARDSGMPVLKTISIMRETIRTTQSLRAYDALLTDAVHTIYSYQRVTPDYVRQTYTLACLKNRTFDTGPKLTKDRY
jgi:hypothetical protein